MADSEAIISSSGGIAAGTPFTLGAGLFVQQVSPPVAFTNRWAALSDAVQSLVAPGVLGAPHTFVVGEGATDSAGGDRSVLIGYNVKQNPTAAASGGSVDQVLIGNTITVAPTGINGAGTIIIGAGASIAVFAAAPTVGSTIIIGRNAIATGINAASGDPSNNVLIGDGARSTGGSGVTIGSGALASDAQSVTIGQNAKAKVLGVAIGFAANASGSLLDVTIGANAKGGTSGCVAVGNGADCTSSTGSLAIGASANTNGGTGVIMLGRNASVAGVNNFCQIGGDIANGIAELRFGFSNALATGGRVYTFSTTDTFGANLAGNSLVIRAGAGTGNNANAGNLGIDLQVGLLQAAGSTVQTYTTALAIRHSDLNIALWGGLGAAFSSGKGVLYVKNATTNPTVGAVAGGGILSAQGGELHWLSSAGVDTALTPGGGGGVTGSGTTGQLAGFTGATAIGNVPLTFTATELGPVATGTISLGDATHAFVTAFVAQVNNPGGALVVNGSNVINFTLGGAAFLTMVSNVMDPTVDLGVQLGNASHRYTGLFLSGATSLSIDNSTTAAAGQIATFTNFPAGKAGNPTKFLNVLVDGANVVIPCW